MAFRPDKKRVITSLTRSRARMTTLGEEMNLISACLAIHRVRMGERLHYALEVAESPGHAGCRIIFVTAYDAYAVEAFEHAAADYGQHAGRRENACEQCVSCGFHSCRSQPSVSRFTPAVSMPYRQVTKAPSKEVPTRIYSSA